MNRIDRALTHWSWSQAARVLQRVVRKGVDRNTRIVDVIPHHYHLGWLTVVVRLETGHHIQLWSMPGGLQPVEAELLYDMSLAEVIGILEEGSHAYR